MHGTIPLARGRLGGLEDELHARDVPPPRRQLGTERLLPPRRGPVVLRAPIVLGGLPLAVDPPALLEPLQRRVERSLIHIERAARELLDALADPPPVHGLEGERLEHEEVERAAENVGWYGGHRPFLCLLYTS